jgi:transposase-like protein/IS1 family transposase
VTCHSCRIECKRKGRDRKGVQRFQCRQCSKTFLEPQEKPLDGMYLPVEKAEAVLKLLLEGTSIATAERLTGVHHTTILKLLVLAGEKCERLSAERIKHVPVADVQADEVWGYVYCKEANRPFDREDDATIGDFYTFIGIERTSKLILAWECGKRDQKSTDAFMTKLWHATHLERFQLTTDGFRSYPSAVDLAFGERVDFATLVKQYAVGREGEARYAPPKIQRTIKTAYTGDPEEKRVCTSHIERTNLSVRMGMRRMTRLTNAFSKKAENLKAAFALWLTFYNFCRVHKTLRCTPAMAAGIADHIWSVRELLEGA